MHSLVSRLSRYNWNRVSCIIHIAFEVNLVASEWYLGRIHLISAAKISPYEDRSQAWGARNRYPDSLNLFEKHKWHDEQNLEENESQPYYWAQNINQFFAGFMDDTSLLNEWLAHCLGDERTAEHVWPRFNSTLYSSNVSGIRDTKTVSMIKDCDGNIARGTANTRKNSS